MKAGREERRGAELVNLRDWGGEGGGERSLFLSPTKAVSRNNKCGEWYVSREALSRVSVRTGPRKAIRKKAKACKGVGGKQKKTNDGDRKLDEGTVEERG